MDEKLKQYLLENEGSHIEALETLLRESDFYEAERKRQIDMWSEKYHEEKAIEPEKITDELLDGDDSVFGQAIKEKNDEMQRVAEEKKTQLAKEEHEYLRYANNMSEAHDDFIERMDNVKNWMLEDARKKLEERLAEINSRREEINKLGKVEKEALDKWQDAYSNLTAEDSENKKENIEKNIKYHQKRFDEFQAQYKSIMPDRRDINKLLKSIEEFDENFKKTDNIYTRASLLKDLVKDRQQKEIESQEELEEETPMEPAAQEVTEQPTEEGNTQDTNSNSFQNQFTQYIGQQRDSVQAEVEPEQPTSKQTQTTRPGRAAVVRKVADRKVDKEPAAQEVPEQPAQDDIDEFFSHFRRPEAGERTNNTEDQEWEEFNREFERRQQERQNIQGGTVAPKLEDIEVEEQEEPQWNITRSVNGVSIDGHEYNKRTDYMQFTQDLFAKDESLMHKVSYMRNEFFSEYKNCDEKIVDAATARAFADLNSEYLDKGIDNLKNFFESYGKLLTGEVENEEEINITYNLAKSRGLRRVLEGIPQENAKKLREKAYEAKRDYGAKVKGKGLFTTIGFGIRGLVDNIKQQMFEPYEEPELLDEPDVPEIDDEEPVYIDSRDNQTPHQDFVNQINPNNPEYTQNSSNSRSQSESEADIAAQIQAAIDNEISSQDEQPSTDDGQEL